MLNLSYIQYCTHLRFNICSRAANITLTSFSKYWKRRVPPVFVNDAASYIPITDDIFDSFISIQDVS